MVESKLLEEGLKIKVINGIKLIGLELIDGIDFISSNFSMRYHLTLKDGSTESSSFISPSLRRDDLVFLKNLTSLKFKEDEEFICKEIEFEFQNLGDQEIKLVYKLF